MWSPPLAYLQWIRAEVETGSPATVKQLLRASLQNHLIYPCLTRAEVSRGRWFSQCASASRRGRRRNADEQRERPSTLR